MILRYSMACVVVIAFAHRVFSDEPARNEITNLIGIKLVLIPSGEFVMGSDEASARKPFESPQHKVSISKPFYMGRCEVTRGEFAKFVTATGYKSDAEKDGRGAPGWNEADESLVAEPDPKYSWRHPGFEQTDDHPVVNVSWNDATAFAEWLSKKESVSYRLPTEAEWEYACRAGSSSEYSFGDDREELTKLGNVLDATTKAKMKRYPGHGYLRSSDGFAFTAPVGSYPANAFGLCDMHGNALEWCQDAYREYTTMDQTDPMGSQNDTVRMMRGGGWGGNAEVARSAERTGSAKDGRYGAAGFRVARTLSDEEIKQIKAKDVRKATPAKNTASSATAEPKAGTVDIEKLPKELTDSIGIKLALIPAGEFQMGSTEVVAQFGNQENLRNFMDAQEEAESRPRHKVRITHPFYLGRHEVTRGQFAKFINATSHKTDAEGDGEGAQGWNDVEQKFEIFDGVNRKYHWRHPGFMQTDGHPVVNVSWRDAKAFCDWLSKKEGAKYRLPTEAEWEYACRAGTQTKWWTGDDPDEVLKVANLADGSMRDNKTGKRTLGTIDGHVFTAPVGSYRANAFGLFDMHGNVAEWCQDWFDYGDYYARSATDDPKGTAASGWRVRRGGAWQGRWGSAAYRFGVKPEHSDFRTGFRVARSP